MRGTRRFILLFFLIIVGTPIAIGGAALMKDSTPPEYYLDFDYVNYDENAAIEEKIGPMVLSNLLGTKKIYIDEETVNKIIYTRMQGFENQYIPITETESILINSIWSQFHNNELTVYALIGYQGVETTLTLKLGFSNIDDGVEVKLNTFKVGKLPIPNSAFTYALNSSVDYVGYDFRDEYTYGEMNYEQLFITINESIIQDLIEYNLNSDMFQFDSIELQNGQFVVNYKYNNLNLQAVAIEKVLIELKNVIKDETTKQEVEAVLDLTNETEAQFNEDFCAVIDQVIIPRMEEETSNLGEFTESEQLLLNSLATNFVALDLQTQEDVVITIENQLSPEVIAEFENEVIQGNESDFTIETLINQFLSTTYTE